jgi:CrcB protein
LNILYGYAVVFLGAGIGGALRHAINRLALHSAVSFPWATLAINVVGSVAMGMVAGWLMLTGDGSHLHGLATGRVGQHFRLFLTTGVLGGFTTFSAFSLDAALFLERGRAITAGLYASGSVILSIAGLLMGLRLMRP